MYTREQIIENLNKETAALDAKLHPKKKFAFTNRSTVKKATPVGSVPVHSDAPSAATETRYAMDMKLSCIIC